MSLLTDAPPNEIQAGLLEDSIRINDLQAEIRALGTYLDDPAAPWNLRQTELAEALALARQKQAAIAAEQAAEQVRRHQILEARKPLLQAVWSAFCARANDDELLVMAKRNKLYGVGWWLDIPSPLHLDISARPVEVLVTSAFRAVRLTRFESHLRNKRSRISQFAVLKKFPSPSGILSFLEVSENKSYALNCVLTRPDAQTSVEFLLTTPVTIDNLSQVTPPAKVILTKEDSRDPEQFR